MQSDRWAHELQYMHNMTSSCLRPAGIQTAAGRWHGQLASPSQGLHADTYTLPECPGANEVTNSPARNLTVPPAFHPTPNDESIASARSIAPRRPGTAAVHRQRRQGNSSGTASAVRPSGRVPLARTLLACTAPAGRGMRAVLAQLACVE